jgi:hypothetical protein
VVTAMLDCCAVLTGGGGGAANSLSTDYIDFHSLASAGGSGVGGAGCLVDKSNSQVLRAPQAGQPNTGSGGGGSYFEDTGAGGSGVVIIRY